MRPERPWISYRAADEINSRVRSAWRVAEFGSGMSTIWFARRVGFLLSIEADPRWYELVSARLNRQRLTNVKYELRSLERYADLSDFPDKYFDFVLVDGEERSRCIRSAVPKIRDGGLLYLDNTDKDTRGGDLRVAESEVLRAVAERGGSLQYFTDLAPSQLIASQGLLARL
jgi:predicted O-methyltransferase YrrM